MPRGQPESSCTERLGAHVGGVLQVDTGELRASCERGSGRGQGDQPAEGVTFFTVTIRISPAKFIYSLRPFFYAASFFLDTRSRIFGILRRSFRVCGVKQYRKRRGWAW